jgi:Putative zinc-finger
MKENELHCSLEQLNLLLDNQLSETEATSIQDHLAHCPTCHLAFGNLQHLDSTLKGLPVLEVKPGFTKSVMGSILGRGGSAVAFRLFEKLSYAFGLLIVLGVMVTSFIVTGAFDGTPVVNTGSVASGVAAHLGHRLSELVNQFTVWLVQYLPFAFGKGSVSVAFFAAMVLLMLAAVDRMVGRRTGKTN